MNSFIQLLEQKEKVDQEIASGHSAWLIETIVLETWPEYFDSFDGIKLQSKRYGEQEHRFIEASFSLQPDLGVPHLDNHPFITLYLSSAITENINDFILGIKQEAENAITNIKVDQELEKNASRKTK